jgi:hypothetical protein
LNCKDKMGEKTRKNWHWKLTNFLNIGKIYYLYVSSQFPLFVML